MSEYPELEVILLGNYAPDAQESMRRYSEGLAQDLGKIGQRVRLVVPPVVVGRLGRSDHSGLGKWGGYVDKYVLFVAVLFVLRLRERVAGRRPVFHICDHSNAPWLRALPRERTVVTCHDVLAIRGSRGHRDTYVTPTRTGRLLQRHILRWLLAGRWVACDSSTTLDQLQELAAEEARWSDANAQRIHLAIAYNDDFTPLDEGDRLQRLAEVGVPADSVFLLHVGSKHPRKNRKLLVELLTTDRDAWAGDVVFAGQPVDDDLRAMIASAGAEERVRQVVRPTHEQLVALYQSCFALVFPSYSEGFGWPVIEAQAAGALVVASELMPMPEVGGCGAAYCDPDQPEEFAKVLRELADPSTAAALRARAELNTHRYDRQVVAARYVALYEDALESAV